MAISTADRYLESEVLNADPVKLVNLLYHGAVEAVAAARRHLAAGEIRARSRQIVKAWNILHELHHSLDASPSPELAARLSALYLYMQQRLLDANVAQDPAPLAEVESLLCTLAEAWRQTSLAAPAPVMQTPYTPVAANY
jgi:flagellar protein FliS